MAVIEPLIISIAANIVTDAGRAALQALIKDDSIYKRIETAYEKALRQWTINDQIVHSERIWSRERFEEVVNRILHPEADPSIDAGTIELLTLFETEIQKDIFLWRYIQGAAFRQLIEQQNRTANYLQNIIKEITSNKIDEIELLTRADKHVRFQINKNITSGKYLPDTFLEVNDLKDHVRYFAHPCLFYGKIFDEVSRFNFDDLHRHQTMNNKPLFEFDVSEDKFKPEANSAIISSCGKDLYEYIAQKHGELYSGGNKSWVFSAKLNHKKEDLEFLTSQILMLTAKAGQGKTNFLCDFTHNVLLKQDVPCLYLNGFEVDSKDVAQSFSKSLYGFYEYQFRDILNGFSKYCHSNNVPLIVIIDGLNENPNPKAFCHSLEAFLREISNYDFVKVLLTCRYEYFQHNYSTITQARSGIKQVDHIYSHLNEIHKARLIHNYLTYFNIRTRLHEDVTNEFSENLLLLRIFSEACQGDNIPYLRTLHKDEIFQAYYEKMCTTVQEKLTSKDSLNVINKQQVRNFIMGVVEYMYTNNTFNNIPLGAILSNLGNDAEVFGRFLDENILLRRDIDTTTIFGNTEVVNFTYDEFRDFLIAKYLIEVVYVRSIEEFKSFVRRHTTEQSRIAEGLRSFLFYLAKKHSNKEINKYLITLDWYNDSFLGLIWNMPEEYVDDADVSRIKALFNPENAQVIITNLLYYGHWDKSEFKKLNIHLLFEILNGLDDDGIHHCLHRHFAYNHGSYYYGSAEVRPRIDNLIDKLEEILEDEDFPKNTEIINLYQFLLYFLPVSSSANYVYRAFIDRMDSTEQAKKLSSVCKSESLRCEILSII